MDVFARPTWREISARPLRLVARAGDDDGAPGPAGKEDESAPSQVTQIYSALSGTTTKTSDKPGESPEEVEGAQLTAILTGASTPDPVGSTLAWNPLPPLEDQRGVFG